jgi:hypothetical protein
MDQQPEISTSCPWENHSIEAAVPKSKEIWARGKSRLSVPAGLKTAGDLA